MKKIFSKEEAQKLQYGDVFCLWRYLDTDFPECFNLIVYNQYSTRLDVYGASKKNLGLTWKTYGIKWVMSTPVNSFDQKNQIKKEDISKYLQQNSN